jgi:Domain of unknown function (DUF4260)
MTANAAAHSIIDPQARRWLQLEGLAVLIAGAAAFGRLGGDYLWLLPALLVPDLAIAGYLAGPRVGAFVYNLVHNWGLGLAVIGAGLVLGITPIALAGAVLIAHTGMDRSVGYGLKFMSGFGDTHLGRIGKAARDSAAAPDRRSEPTARTVAG